MVGVLEKVVRRCLFVCGDVVEMARRCRGWRCGGDGVVVEMRLWLLRCGCSKIKIAKE